MRVLFAVVVLLLLSTQAEARYCARYGICTVHRAWPEFSYRERCCLRWAPGERYAETYRLPEGETYYYAAPRYDREERYHCHPLQRVVGNQHLTVEGAKKAADEAWAGDVRFRFGELYMSLDNARSVVYTCSRSSIKEGGVTTLGQTLTRCEIQATPCRAPRSQPLPPPEDRDDR